MHFGQQPREQAREHRLRARQLSDVPAFTGSPQARLHRGSAGTLSAQLCTSTPEPEGPHGADPSQPRLELVEHLGQETHDDALSLDGLSAD